MSQFQEEAYKKITDMNENPPKTAVLFGDPRSPYLRIDPYFMNDFGDSETSRAALRRLVNAIDNNLSDVVLEPGDCIFIDNFRAVHGRKAFVASYNGKDRWLKRINISRDLRKSREARLRCESRIIC
jgi:hypothetical protein